MFFCFSTTKKKQRNHKNAQVIIFHIPLIRNLTAKLISSVTVRPSMSSFIKNQFYSMVFKTRSRCFLVPEALFSSWKIAIMDAWVSTNRLSWTRSMAFKIPLEIFFGIRLTNHLTKITIVNFWEFTGRLVQEYICF